MKEKDLAGKKVVSMADGAEVGTVKELVFHGLKLSGLVVHGESGEGLLPFKDLGTNGPDAITIESSGLVDWSVGKIPDPDGRNMHDLRKLPFMDGDGNTLGRMHDLTMNEAGVVEDIDVRTEGVFGLGSQETVVSASQVRAVGPDMITVEAGSKA